MIELCQNFWRSASQHEEEFWTNITKSTQCQVSYPENFEWALSVVDLKNGTFCQLHNNDLEKTILFKDLAKFLYRKLKI